MPEEREALINRIMETNRRLYHQHLQLGGGREWAEVDLTMPQLKVLFLVAVSNGVAMTQLARAVGMTLSTATGVADRLIAQGFVRREDDPGDRRLVLLRPTAAGVAVVDRLTQVRRAYFQAIANRLSVEELAFVARALDIMHRATLELSSEALRTSAGED